MTKRELIDQIVAINKSASPSFLARFDDVQLDEYLTHLRVLETPRLSGNARKYEKYFRNCPTIHAPRPLWRTDSAAIEEIAAEELDDEGSAGEEFEAEPVEEFAEDFIEQPVGPAEREQLYAESMDAEVEDGEEFAPEPEDTDGPVPVDTLLGDSAEDAEDETDETDQADDADDAETEVAVAAAAETDRAETPFADQEEDSEAWLY